ncbi:uncharacterized protein LOC132619664 [Lycium barbarum]|uniref:uncharacterized protein LOC132619664 n=1 Tax=Lycium barbarum TaxID=112863 RepID=UPI00293E7A5D|nr:uncharacterized protein LOC132619664 [Lycium barbarum]
MAPFEALYERRCRYPIGWFDAFELRPWETVLLRESLDKVKVIQEKLLSAKSRQKEYADRKVRDLVFIVGEQVLLKVSPMNVMLDENFSYKEEHIALLDRVVRKFRSKEIASVKVQWKNRSIEDAT